MQRAALQSRVAGPTARARPARDALAARPFAVPTERTGEQRETEPGKPASIAAGPVFSFGKLCLQPKLTIGPSDDPFEQEADRMAEHVIRMPALPAGGGLLQRKCSVCAEEDQLQRRAVGSPVQGTAEPSSVYQVLQSPGRPLETHVREFMEPRFGHDFSDVHIHTDASASRSAEEVAARAYTVGRNVAFRQGEYSPDTTEGRRLLAHELAHVVQQNSATPLASVGHEAHGFGGDEGVVRRQGDSVADLDQAYNAALQSEDWQIAAEKLNAFNTEDIQSRLARLTADQVASLHQGALDNPNVGPQSQVAQLTAPGQPPSSTAQSQTHYRFEIKAWIPFLHVPDPEEPLREVGFRIEHSGWDVKDYDSSYRGDAHPGYEGSHRVFQVAEFDWDGTAISNVTFPQVAHFGTSHRDFIASVRTTGSLEDWRVFEGVDVATADSAVTGSMLNTQEVDLGMSSSIPLTLFPAPAIDADYSLFISQDTLGIETVTVRWTTDFMPNHGYRVIRNGTVVKEHIVNALPGPPSAPEIFVRLTSKSNGGADSFEPASSGGP